MNKVVLGLATMDAGRGMPGSSLHTLLNTCAKVFKKIIIVDGQPSSFSYSWYKQFPNVTVLNNLWAGSLKAQYDVLVKHLDPGDWWVMLDDDELPSLQLLQLISVMQYNLDQGKHALNNIVSPENNTIYTPRITCFTEDGVNFYPGEELPSNPPKVGQAGPRAHIFLYNDKLKMMHSPAGRHVVPYHEHGSRIYIDSAPHLHLKAPEMYVYNDCVKALLDHDIKNTFIEQEYRAILNDCDIVDGNTFMEKTQKREVTKDFENLCLKYRTHGAPEGRLFIWYYNILHPELNPVPEQDWTASLKLVLNENWRRIYIRNKAEGKPIVSDITYPRGNGRITL